MHTSTVQVLQRYLFAITVIGLLSTQLAFGETRPGGSQDVQIIERLFQQPGKNQVVEFIVHKRNGAITLSLKGSFRETYGRPNMEYISAQSVLKDLKKLDMSTTELETELTAYLQAKEEREKKQYEAQSRRTQDPSSDEDYYRKSKRSSKDHKKSRNCRKAEDKLFKALNPDYELRVYEGPAGIPGYSPIYSQGRKATKQETKEYIEGIRAQIKEFCN